MTEYKGESRAESNFPAAPYDAEDVTVTDGHRDDAWTMLDCEQLIEDVKDLSDSVHHCNSDAWHMLASRWIQGVRQTIEMRAQEIAENE